MLCVSVGDVWVNGCVWQEASVFMFEKRIADKLHKPKRREIVTDLLRRDAITLSRMRHHRILRVLHSPEECK